MLHVGLIFCALFAGQHPDLHLEFEVLSVDQGLSQNSPRVILQDHQGYLWIGTHDGLNKYDGYKFDIFYHDPNDATSLSDDFVLSLVEDAKGFLWVGTGGGGLNRFDPETKTCIHYRHQEDDEKSLSDDFVNALHVDADGRVWAGTRRGLDLLDPKTGQFQRLLADFEGQGNMGVGSIFEDRSGRLWVGTTGGGLLLLDGETGTYERFLPGGDDPNRAADNLVMALEEDRNGVLWVGCISGSIYTFHGVGEFRRINDSMGDHIRIRNGIAHIMEDSTGQIWISISGDGVIRKDADNHRWTQHVNDPANPLSLKNNFVFSVMEDSAGSLWVGTGGGGVSIVDRRKRKFVHFRKAPTSRASQPANFVWAIEEDVTHRGQVFWIGTQGAGLQKFIRQDNAFTQVTFDDRLGAVDETILAICVTGSEGPIWVGTQGGGLIRYEKESGDITRYTNVPDHPESLSSNVVRSIMQDRQGDLWLGTTGRGINRFDPKTGRCRRYLNDADDENSLSNNQVFSIYEDRTGLLWIGTQGGGLNRFDPKDEFFTRYLHDPQDPKTLSNNRVRVVCEAPASEDASQLLWVGTDHGLNRFDRETEEFFTYTVSHGLPNNVIYGILADERGHLWISTNRGISKFDPKTETFRNYDHDDGLQSNEFNTGAFCRTQTGEFVFGGVNGFNIFDPLHIVDNPHIPPIVITQFKVLNQATDLKTHSAKNLDARSTDPEPIVLSHEENMFSFEFAALDYSNPQKNRYAYTLEGFQKEWVYCGNHRTAAYTNLDPGDYVFRVKGANSDGVWNPEPLSIKISITPPFWKTSWAYVIYCLAIIALLYGFREFALAKERARARVTESELRAQAAEAKTRAVESENARKTVELEEARKLQLSMLPKKLPDLAHIDIAVYMQPATEVGGDYYDFHIGDDGTLTVAIGDATGHGIKAGMMVAMAKERFVADGAQKNLSGFFEKFNRVFKQMDLENLYMSLTMLKIKDDSLIAACAGMPPIYVYKAQDGSIQELNLRGMPLGGVDDFFYQEEHTSLHPGDSILLLTDGLPELFSPKNKMFDYPSVGRVFAEVAHQSPQEIINHLVRTGEDWRGGRPQDDDITFVVLKIRPA